MLLERVRSHNYINGLKFSAVEFIFAALIIIPFLVYYSTHHRIWSAILAVGLILNFLTIVLIAFVSAFKKEKSIGIQFYTDPILRKDIAKTYPHLTIDTLILCASMLIPFVLCVIVLVDTFFYQKRIANIPPLPILLWITLLNYLAQIPYYFHNYYNPYHVLPALGGVILLSATLTWFLVGYFFFEKGKMIGTYVLVSFLVTEALFYFLSLVSGAFLFQMHNPSILIKGIFIIGYISGAISGYYAFAIKHHALVQKQF